MKPIEKLSVLLLVFSCYFSSAQVSKDNKSSLSATAKTEIRYYYFPNIEAYFDLQETVYLYKEDGQWVEAEELPANYGGYSLYNKVRVTIENYDGDEPYLMLAEHKKMYPYNSKGRFPTPKTQTAASE